jgi:hypothetical protein
MGKKKNMINAFHDLRDLYEKRGGKNLGFWWTIGGEGDEASWLFSWRNLNNYQKAMEEVPKENTYPIEEIASIAISLTDKILLPA